jgi:hypothetical protein
LFKLAAPSAGINSLQQHVARQSCHLKKDCLQHHRWQHYGEIPFDHGLGGETPKPWKAKNRLGQDRTAEELAN